MVHLHLLLEFHLTLFRGTQIWRIENFVPVPYPKSEYGRFYSGDSYIVLQVLMTLHAIFSYRVFLSQWSDFIVNGLCICRLLLAGEVLTHTTYTSGWEKILARSSIVKIIYTCMLLGDVHLGNCQNQLFIMNIPKYS